MTVSILEMDGNSLIELSRRNSLSLSMEEMKAVQDYFRGKGRDPTDVELECIAQTWSEHCVHKTFKSTILLEKDGKEHAIEGLMKSYIFKVTEELAQPWCFSVFRDNAGIIEFENGYGIAVKVETHNHPSAIEPFGGAATGVGGVIRDIMGVWAEPIANTDVLCFGPLDFEHEKLPHGVKHPRFIFSGVTSGVGSYGNCMGIATVNGAICFDESYVGSPLVYCGCIGLLPLDKYRKETRAGDVALLVGGKTGRDGLHGVTFSSAELTKESEELSRPAVQIANPVEQEKVKRAILETRDRALASNITDLGGGGLSSAACEMASNSGLGVVVYLDKAPLREAGMSAWEIFVSESQERMLLSVPRENLEQVLEIFAAEDVEATPAGEFTEKKTLEAHFGEEKIAELDMDFLFNVPKPVKKAVVAKKEHQEPVLREPEDLGKILLGLLSAPNIASKESVIRTYDHEIKGNTILKPLQGAYGSPNDAAVLRPLEGSEKGVVISCGIKPRYGRIDAYWMAASAIDEAVRNNVAAGGRRIALLDNFCWGNPDKPDRLGDLAEAARACYDFGKLFETPFISGKDSLNNESPLGPVVPTLLVTAVGIIPDVARSVSTELKQAGNPIYAVGTTYSELGGSEYYDMLGYLGSSVPEVRREAAAIFRKVTEAIDSGYVRACHDVSEGGLGVAAAEMALGSACGLTLHLDKVPRQEANRDDFLLFSESNSRFLVEVQKERERDFETLMQGLPCARIGEVTAKEGFVIHGLGGNEIISLPAESLRNAWKGGLKS